MQTNANHSAGPGATCLKDVVAGASSPLAWVAAIATVAVIATVQQLDIPDYSAEWDKSTRLNAELQAQAAAARRERAAQAMCQSDHGSNVLAVWLDESTVECVNKRGRRLSRNIVESTHAAR